MANAIRKRIALAAAVALGAGLLSAVPAQAGSVTAFKFGATPTQDLVVYTNLGVVADETMTLTGVANGDTFTATLDKPVGSALTFATAGGASLALISGTNTSFNTTTGVATIDTASGSAPQANINPDVAGKYVVSVQDAPAETATLTVHAADLYATKFDGSVSGNQSNLAVGGVAGASNSVELTVSVPANTNRLVTIDNETILAASAGTVASDKKSVVIFGTGARQTVTLRVSTVATGTITAKLYKETQDNSGIFATTTAIGTVTVTVRSAAVAGSVDASASTAVMAASGSGTTLSEDKKSLIGPRTAGNAVATITVTGVSSLTGVSIATLTTASASISGAGYLGWNHSAGSATGRSLTALTKDGDDTFIVTVYGDGTSGVATVTISYGAFTATRTVTFYGSVASITAIVDSPVIPNSGSATAGAIQVHAKDSAGIIVPAVALTITSSDTTIVGDSTGTSATQAEVIGEVATVSVTGKADKFGKVTLTIADSATKLITTKVDVTVADEKAVDVKLAFDKATYAAGELITLTLSATEVNGLPVADGVATDFLTAALVSSAGVTSALQFNTDATKVTFNGGKAAVKFYAPLSGGTLTVTGKTGTSATYLATAVQGKTLTATATIGSSADITQIKADLAALQKSTSDLIAALSAQVSYLRKQLNQLLRRR